jgi:hypothetical protein
MAYQDQEGAAERVPPVHLREVRCMLRLLTLHYLDQISPAVWEEFLGLASKTEKQIKRLGNDTIVGPQAKLLNDLVPTKPEVSELSIKQLIYGVRIQFLCGLPY